MKSSAPLHEDRLAATGRALALQVALDATHGDAAAARAWMDRREALIASLPALEWRGRRGDRPPRTLRTIRCHGTTGRGPHDVHLPESLLWHLIDPLRYQCPYHPIHLEA